ncbi:hypothetical protein [Mesorhizobium sp. STM 4661]|uniref:hypothetical protein n=1 Tax=Mesorhizobium sp. STM 4661 TaxID=1297570 RepID=UPI0003A367EF|nr:hypothetical protein [Mesorhizobium sp. STM 4661]
MVFDWTQQESNSTGQLHCALNGLERWLTLRLDQGADIDRYLERLLDEGNSLAFIGLLVNIAKYRPVLLSGVLMPVLSSESVFWLDAGRVKNSRFNAFAWCRTGESVFNAARDWAAAPYRQRNLLELVSPLIRRDVGVATFLKAAMSNWKKPKAPKEAIEFSILCAQLDEANYRVNHDPHTGEETVEFDCPEAVKVEAVAFQQASAPKLRNLMLAYRCEQVLQQRGELADRDAEILASVLTAAPTEDDSDDKGRQALNRLAAAATLVVCAGAWLAARRDAEEAAKSELRVAADGIANDFESLRRRRVRFDEPLKFAAHGIFHLWRRGGSEEPRWEQALLCILTSGDGHAAGVVGFLAHHHRTALGERWWRLLQLGTLWSALSMLGPDYDDLPDIAVHWQRWVRWLRSRRVSGVPRDRSHLDPLGTWQRLKSLERARWRRRASDENRDWLPPSHEERVSHGLDTGFLASFFGWLLAEDSRPEGENLEAAGEMILLLWSYEAAFCSEHRNERDEYSLPDQFGYNIIAKLAFYAAHLQADRASEVWRGVLGLGPAARHLIEHFVGAWFIELSHGCDATAFCARWQDMIEFALDGEWTKGGYWFDEQRILQQLLGFGSEAFLTNLPDAASTVLAMRELYQRWAETNLQIDEENVAAFAYFLASKSGTKLRTDGVKWLAASFGGAVHEQYWRDRKGTGDALVNLLDVTLQENALVLRRDPTALDALVALASYLVARQVPTALTLQKRIKRLR